MQQENLVKLKSIIGGEWAETHDPVAGIAASFPRYRTDAIVSVLNAAAQHAGATEQVIFTSTGVGAVSRFMAADPQAPRQVVVPEKLLDNEDFAAQLNSDLRAEVVAQTARQLQSGVGLGMR